jgi:hypothetical protein
VAAAPEVKTKARTKGQARTTCCQPSRGDQGRADKSAGPKTVGKIDLDAPKKRPPKSSRRPKPLHPVPEASCTRTCTR